MRKIMIILFLIFTQLLYSQELFRVSEPEVLVTPFQENQHFMNPKWSPDDSKIAFTSANYRGIWIYDMTTGEIAQVTDELAAGYGFSWSPDAQMILARVSQYEGPRRFSAFKILNIEEGNEINLTEYVPNLPDVPKWTNNGRQIYFHNGKKVEFIETGISFNQLQEASMPQPVLYSRGDKIIINHTTGERKELQPFPGAEYLNVTLSPDGELVAFEVYGGNCYIMNLQTSEMVDLGQVNYPQWAPEGDYIAYMVARDDGHNYIASDIYVADRQGNIRQNITDHTDAIAMYPSWSPSGERLVYSAYHEGEIVMINLTPVTGR